MKTETHPDIRTDWKHMKKTLSQIRREAGKKGAAARKYTAEKDPLRTVSIRNSTKAILEKLAEKRGQTMTDTLHAIITKADQTE